MMLKLSIRAKMNCSPEGVNLFCKNCGVHHLPPNLLYYDFSSPSLLLSYQHCLLLPFDGATEFLRHNFKLIRDELRQVSSNIEDEQALIRVGYLNCTSLSVYFSISTRTQNPTQ